MAETTPATLTHIRRGMAMLVGSLALVAGLAACTTFDREGSIQEFVDLGLTEAQATCAVDGMVEEFGEDKLQSDDDPTPEDEAKILEIISKLHQRLIQRCGRCSTRSLVISSTRRLPLRAMVLRSSLSSSAMA